MKWVKFKFNWSYCNYKLTFLVSVTLISVIYTLGWCLFVVLRCKYLRRRMMLMRWICLITTVYWFFCLWSSLIMLSLSRILVNWVCWCLKIINLIMTSFYIMLIVWWLNNICWGFENFLITISWKSNNIVTIYYVTSNLG